MRVRVLVATTALLVAAFGATGEADAKKKKTKKFDTEIAVTSSTPPSESTGPGRIDGKIDSKSSKCLGDRPVTVAEADAAGSPSPFPSTTASFMTLGPTDGSGNFAVLTGGSSTVFPNVIIEVSGAKKGNVVCKAATLVTPRP
jgi:hypothetical protein